MSPRRRTIVRRHTPLRLSGITQASYLREPGLSAREIFPGARERLLASRPIAGYQRDKQRNGRMVPGDPIYGKPTFRNVIEDGEHR